jgi:hypothetical protein
VGRKRGKMEESKQNEKDKLEIPVQQVNWRAFVKQKLQRFSA